MIKQFFTTYTLWLILFVYLVSRLIFLTSLPIFTDESIYIYWAKIIATTHDQLFISLTDGKPPLLIWMIATFLSLLPENSYLIAGRLPSVIAGFASVIALWKLSLLLFSSRRTAIVICLLYILHPFTLLYDRMALFDSLLSSTLLWSVYFSFLTAKTRRIRDAVLWGLALGLAFLSKPTAAVFLLLTPFSMLWYGYIEHKKISIKINVLLISTAIVIAEIINNLQRLSRVYFLVDRKNSQFQQPIAELLKDPFQLVYGNMSGFFSWIISYYTIPFLFIVILGFLFLSYKKIKIGLPLFLFWMAPMVALAIVGREIFPRYILFTTPYALIAAGYFITLVIDNTKRYRVSLSLLFFLLVLPLISFSMTILTTPEKAPYPRTDYNQYVGDHPSGYGLKEIYAFLSSESKDKKITVVTQGTFGLYPYAFTLEYWGNPNITVLPRWPLDKFDDEILQSKEKGKVFIIFKEHDTVPENLPVTILFKAEKPGGRYPIFVTQLQ